MSWNWLQNPRRREKVLWLKKVYWSKVEGVKDYLLTEEIVETTIQSPKEPPKRDQIKDVEPEERTHPEDTKETDTGRWLLYLSCVFFQNHISNIFLIQETQGQWQKGKQEICKRKNLMRKTKIKLLNRKV